jgi:hypothetical protein
MTDEQAEYIKMLRMDLGYTWRSVAMDVTGRDNQRVGRQLCEEAENVLGIFFDKEETDVTL